MAARQSLPPIEHKALVNLYALKSGRVRELAALTYFLQTEAESCQRIAIHHDGIEVLRSFAPGQAEKLLDLGPWESDYITRPAVLFVGLKMMLHRLFRLFARPVAASGSMVRGWVEVTASMYEQEMPGSSVRLYPFPYGILRQWRFLQHCRRRGLDVALAGIPYSGRHMLRLVLSRRPSAVAVVAAEVDGYRRYSAELLAQGVRQVHTSDEFEIAALALYEPLIAQQVNVVNTAHGVGLYAPYVAYSEFRGVNLAQAEFYRRRCPSLCALSRRGKNTRLALGSIDEVRDREPSIVLIDQNFMDFNCHAEAQALVRIRDSLERLSVSTGVPLFIKIHPNSKHEGGKQSGEAVYVRSWQELAGHRPVFVMVNSTAWYDVQGHGPALVCDEHSFYPEIYFGADLDRFVLDNLEARVRALFDPQRWYEAAVDHQHRGEPN